MYLAFLISSFTVVIFCSSYMLLFCIIKWCTVIWSFSVEMITVMPHLSVFRKAMFVQSLLADNCTYLRGLRFAV